MAWAAAAKGELRKLNVTAGLGGKSYLSYLKVPESRKSAKRYLRQLTEFGYLESHGGNRNRSYRIRDFK